MTAESATQRELLEPLAKRHAEKETLRWGLVRLFVATGERRGEALGTHWADFDPDKKVLAMTGNPVSARARAQSEQGLPDWCVRMLEERRATSV